MWCVQSVGYEHISVTELHDLFPASLSKGEETFQTVITDLMQEITHNY